jgi:hypothetical protein
MTLEDKNRWTASSATILGVASRGPGVFAAGGSGTLRLLNGIQIGIRDVELGQMITKIELETACQNIYRNVSERVYLGCGIDGVACVEFGFPDELKEQGESPLDGKANCRDSPLAGEYSDIHFFRSRFRNVS